MIRKTIAMDDTLVRDLDILAKKEPDSIILFSFGPREGI